MLPPLGSIKNKQNETPLIKSFIQIFNIKLKSRKSIIGETFWAICSYTLSRALNCSRYLSILSLKNLFHSNVYMYNWMENNCNSSILVLSIALWHDRSDHKVTGQCGQYHGHHKHVSFWLTNESTDGLHDGRDETEVFLGLLCSLEREHYD